MLSQLNVKKFALIDSLTLNFSKSLVVLTGETGAGKSILIDAIRFVLGERLDQIRGPMEDGTQVEAVFEIQDPRIRAQEELRPFLEDEEALLILRREVSSQNRSRCFVNQRNVTTSTLKAIGSHLLDIHGQYDHQLLLEPSSQREILDRLAKTGEQLAAYEQFFKSYSVLAQKKQELNQARQTREREMDLLEYQVQEIEAAEIEEMDEEAIRLEKIRVANAERLYETVQAMLAHLDQDEPSASGLMMASSKYLTQLQKLDESTKKFDERFQDIQLNLEEWIRDLSDYQDQLSVEPGRAEELENRLHGFELMKKKYGGSLEAVREYYRQAREKLDQLENLDHDAKGLEEALHSVTPQLKKSARALSEKRKQAASTLKKQMARELRDLEMNRAEFDCLFQKTNFEGSGYDQIEFMTKINLGQPLMPLRKMVSAGEISRIMLALKKTLAHVDSVPTLIFDEIDANIGGRLGRVTGEKLKEISSQRQVLLITHLPQIASFADQHIKVTKRVSQGRTHAEYSTIHGEERIGELAQMMSGKEETAISKQHAKELLAKVKGG